MFGTRWRRFRLMDRPMSFDASWIIILALFTLSLARGLSARIYRYLSIGGLLIVD